MYFTEEANYMYFRWRMINTKCMKQCKKDLAICSLMQSIVTNRNGYKVRHCPLPRSDPCLNVGMGMNRNDNQLELNAWGGGVITTITSLCTL